VTTLQSYILEEHTLLLVAEKVVVLVVPNLAVMVDQAVVVDKAHHQELLNPVVMVTFHHNLLHKVIQEHQELTMAVALVVEQVHLQMVDLVVTVYQHFLRILVFLLHMEQ
jgi:hypothetical protein|tara:strand:+ start:1299 stop:1628 length:330 start_codon:yes stop_codon:yes gene_type:complete